ncbi:MAG: alpha,alpha-trehalase TreF [Asticcacaulis sp.]|uniref:alpha,alpha-trehalase TreF n=1 Tax=Asticcacaulis sp. TaxID=1872648 RepID=UPI003F7C9C31
MTVIRTLSVSALIVAFASCAHAAAPPTPADLYGPLFDAVQLNHVFPDGKTFVDMTPKRAPDAIMADYNAHPPQDAQALRAFVEANFDAPAKGNDALAPQGLSLKAHIKALWPILARPPLTPPAGSSALALPQAYVVPGGRFREIYYWDSYFTLLGLYADGEDRLARGMIDDFESLIERYGHIPNGARSYYLSRSQPPFFALMTQLKPSGDPDPARTLKALRAEHDYWMKGASCAVVMKPCRNVVKMKDGELLNRYWDERDTPREESYAEDVATAAKSARPKAEVYRDLRAAAESGWDFSSRWLNDPMNLETIHTTDIVPVDLNSLLWKDEMIIAARCETAGDARCARDYKAMAQARKMAIRRYLWRQAQHRYADYDWRAGRPTTVISAATLYPLFVGLADKRQATAVATLTRLQLTAQGGLRTTQIPSGQQWDDPNGWPPLQWIAISGLDAYGFHKQAHDLASRFIGTVDAAYLETGKMLEKYDVEQRRPGGGGEYPLQDGFGWTNGVTRAILAKYPDPTPQAGS